MNILDKNIQAKFTIKKSKFLCFGYIVKNKDEAKSIVSNIKHEYPDASHVCYAYLLSDKEFYHTDGGEPSGTAGIPIYNAIKSFNLNYCLFVVVRYFGGIKFGPGPLRSTCKQISIDTLKQAKICQGIISDVIQIRVEYNKFKSTSKILKPFIKNLIYTKEYVTLELVGDTKQILKLLNELKLTIVKIEKNRLIK